MLADYTSAPVSEGVRATLRLLEKMTLEHGTIGPEDARAALRAGVSKRALEEAIEVAFLFNIYDRLADAMGWDVPSRDSGFYQLSAQRLLKHGYE